MQWTIGEAAKRTGCPASTIRYYERIGLVDVPARGDNGYRYYDAAAIERLTFAHQVRALGFSIETVAELLQLAYHPGAPCQDIHRLVAAQIDKTHARLVKLQKLESELARLQSECEGGHTVGHCGVLSAITGPTDSQRSA